uniref:Lon N-terminal domain-containing protein n=1 Tax=Craspedostauros australis TaxID=1486917 RepID=A0A7R9WP48_9STRA|mmetsp:Transcript_11039/g.30498  ORF Transcript_11039/g.30498 Transcript_11039/m.30498 type:complete len:374 (+) Transcript_11039:83-1204(+)|eukprot:CAMPEP_0198117768 /NCGR_PEP_ID=MMETSP1442-20131203/19227_1 /TAXON_ID= /ORGANISM="Craspedostauros australis, Strain CCMP3328" /LENGTH=373 /DNA_ID=CAMNT_0043775887 /DNA_START=37 /DNA_END=1158 /DNA_ORIENTATION=+
MAAMSRPSATLIALIALQCASALSFQFTRGVPPFPFGARLSIPRASCHQHSSPAAATTATPTSLNMKEDESKEDKVEDSFMDSLKQRIEEVKDSDTTLPILLMEPVLPRQTLVIQTNMQQLLTLIKYLIKHETPRLGMIGQVATTDGKTPDIGPPGGTDMDDEDKRFIPLFFGVEMEIQGTPDIRPIPSDMEPAPGGSDEVITVALAAKRRFSINRNETIWEEGELQGISRARVKFLNSGDEESKEELGEDMYDPMSLSRAEMMAKVFDEMKWKDTSDKRMVDHWIELARKNEKKPGQIDRLLQSLGEMPPATEPSERAFWIGALINPLPKLDVAQDIRGRLLVSPTAESRIHLTMRAMINSIELMESGHIWF